MSIQGAIEGLVKAFIVFYVGCVSVGRADIPIRMIHELRTKALSSGHSNNHGGWGCPSIFNPKLDCNGYDMRRFR